MPQSCQEHRIVPCFNFVADTWVWNNVYPWPKEKSEFIRYVAAWCSAHFAKAILVGKNNSCVGGVWGTPQGDHAPSKGLYTPDTVVTKRAKELGKHQ